MVDDDTGAMRVRWARLRFSIIGPLLSAPPETGELWAQIEALAEKSWRHPTTTLVIRFSAKTIERWLYTARIEQDPIKALERKVPKHAGTFPSVSDDVAAEIRGLRRDHPRWTFQLVHDNLVAITVDKPKLLPLPGYASVCRFMRHHGLGKARRQRRHELEAGFVARERRSFEVRHSHALWHCDFHDCSRNVLLPNGEWKKPFLFGVLDDHSRLCCHAQWYLDVTTDSLVHGLSQAIMKRGLPRALLSDNGSAMVAAETVQGLERLSITHETILPRTPEQNGKQEAFWGVIEGRLMPMLEGQKELTLELLNRATQAFVEEDYHRNRHSEIHEAPLTRYLREPHLGRPSPSSDALRRAFRIEMTRTQRRSDGTITVEGVRYEIPAAYRTLLRPCVRVARWDLSSIELVDPRTGVHLSTLTPIDKHANSDGRRRAIPRDEAPSTAPATGIAPLLKQQMADYAATGAPPAYIPKPIATDDDDDAKNVSTRDIKDGEQ